MKKHSRSSAFSSALMAVLLLLSACKQDSPVNCHVSYLLNTPDSLSRIAFGSCSRQTRPLPILYDIADAHPDMMIWLGDNVYGDSHDMNVIQGKYRDLYCKPEFAYLASRCFFLATWDDHDYGQNDAGAEYPCKASTKKLFLDFWNEPATSSRWQHEGIYHAVELGDTSRRIQVILLDLRTFRTHEVDSDSGYIQVWDPAFTMLGNEQWAWLENELQKPAKLRLICSSSQFGSEYSGQESWENYPLEWQRMVQLIRSTRAEGVVFLSGDVHYAEFSRRDESGMYPLYDLTASGMNQIDEAQPNRYRVGTAVEAHNFGLLDIAWDSAGVPITARIHGLNGEEKILHRFLLSDLRLP